MTVVSDVTPPKPPSPGAVGKSAKGVLKGHPKWVYVAGITLALGIAYFVWRNGQAADDAAVTDGAPDQSTYGTDFAGTGPVGGAYSSDPLYPAASQGAYGGYDSPYDYGYAATDSAGNPEAAPPVVVNVTYPGVTAGGGDNVPGSRSNQAVTGGGHPAQSVASHLPPVHLDSHGQDSGLHFITVDRGGVTTRLYETKRGKGDFGSTKASVVSLGTPAPKALPSFVNALQKAGLKSPVKPKPTPPPKPSAKKRK